MKKVCLSHRYNHPARMVWDVAVDFAHFEKLMKGLISFKGLPKGRLKKRQKLEVDVSLFGLLPYQPYRMEVVEFSEEDMSFLSDEKGSGVKYWRHKFKVTSVPEGCVVDEEIEIEAGRMTWLFAKWAQFMYTKRHKRRIKLISELIRQSD